jgi:hypothetical protein
VNQQEFRDLNNKVLTKLREHPKVVEQNLFVAHQKHPFYGDIFEIEENVFALSNNGAVAEWKRIQ